jgi:hypothetical protein
MESLHGGECISTMVSECSILTPLVAKSCSSVFRMWRAVLPWVAYMLSESLLKLKQKSDAVDHREGPLPFSHKYLFHLLPQVQVPDNSLILGLIHYTFLEPGLPPPARILVSRSSHGSLLNLGVDILQGPLCSNLWGVPQFFFGLAFRSRISTFAHGTCTCTFQVL